MDIDLEEYNRMKEADPEFYREASSLQYGKVRYTPQLSLKCVQIFYLNKLKNLHEKKENEAKNHIASSFFLSLALLCLVESLLRFTSIYNYIRLNYSDSKGCSKLKICIFRSVL